MQILSRLLKLLTALWSFRKKVIVTPKKLDLFPEIGRVNFFYHSPDHIVERVSEYIFLIVKEKHKKIKKTKSKRN